VSNTEEIEIILKGINNITDISEMFYDCESLISLPDIFNWNTSKVTNMKEMFAHANH
jgi:surface protein